MQTYLFYPRRLDGSDVTPEAHECADDGEALARAETLLRTDRSAMDIAVWQGDRHVGSRSQDRESELGASARRGTDLHSAA